MRELDKTQEAVLAECLQALDAGASVEDCLARYPQHANALRPYLELRAGLHSIEAPDPPAAAYAAGRQALLERMATPIPAIAGSPWRATLRAFLVNGWLRSPLPRVAAVAVLVLAVAGGALGASAAAGVDEAHDVLSALRSVGPSGQGDQQKSPNADEGSSNQNDGIGNAAEASDTGQQHADDRASTGSDNANNGADEEHWPCLPAGLLDRVPALQDLFSSCAENGEPPGAIPTHTPSSSQGEREDPTNSALDHRPITPPRPTDAGPQSEEH